MSKGFTLIELMTTMSVIAIISAAVFANFSGPEKQLALKRAAYQVAQDIREAEEMALAAADVDCSSKNFCGFGLEFDPAKDIHSYWLFADCENNCANSNFKRDSGDKDIKQIFLEKAVEIQETAPSQLNVVFSPPDPTVSINSVNWGTEATITLRLLNGQNKKVKVNSVGRVEME